MKVRFTVSVAGVNYSHVGGQVEDLPDDEARGWIGRGLATAVDEPKAKRPRKRRGGKTVEVAEAATEGVEER